MQRSCMGFFVYVEGKTRILVQFRQLKDQKVSEDYEKLQDK